MERAIRTETGGWGAGWGLPSPTVGAGRGGWLGGVAARSDAQQLTPASAAPIKR